MLAVSALVRMYVIFIWCTFVQKYIVVYCNIIHFTSLYVIDVSPSKDSITHPIPAEVCMYIPYMGYVSMSKTFAVRLTKPIHGKTFAVH